MADIIIKNHKQISNIRKSGKYLTELLYKLQKAAVPGMFLIELESIAEAYMQEHKVKGAFKHYDGFPANLCLSINDCLVHGIPDQTQLKKGDLLKIDCGVNYEGGITDAAISVVIGGEDTNPLGKKLVHVTKEALDLGMEHVMPGKTVYDYAHAVQLHVESQGCKIIEKLTGHGVGVKVHEQPYIHNYPHPDTKKIKFIPGMVLAFEPITAIISNDFTLKRDNDRNLYTKKWDIGAHREYTVLITEHGHEIIAGIV